MKTIKPFGTLTPESLCVTLGDTNPDVVDALARAFERVDSVEVIHGDLLNISCDAIVSPANSFGDMGGGIDKAIDDFHQGEAQRRVMQAIREQHLGELPVGMAIVVELGTRHFPFIIASPTMRIPNSVQGSINAYLSMRATLVAVLRHNLTAKRTIKSFAVPGLGTGVGGMDYRDAAQQMRAAYDNVVGNQWKEIVIGAQAPYAFRR